MNLFQGSSQNIKTDNNYPFLQSLSHEVRTPVNAIVGLSEILLRRSHDIEEQEYLMAIQAAAQQLVMVVNNIIDYNAMNEGTLSIKKEEVSLKKLIHEIIAMGRLMIGDRDVVFVTDVNPNLPAFFISDEDRIKQILVYFLSNAAKNTKKGHIALNVDYADDRKKFIRFTIENTEPGLPIMADLIKALGSDLKITRNEENGTDVSCDIRLELPVNQECEKTKLPGSYAVCLKNKREREMLIKYFERTEIPCIFIDNPTELFIISDDERPRVLITDYERLEKLRSIREFMELHVRLIGVASEKDTTNREDKALLQRPIFYSDLEEIISKKEAKSEKMKLVLEDARILVVDDNAINLKVSEGLLAPYKCKIDTATGGEEAVTMIQKTRYDLVLMDHMMPKMDGTQAVKIIRDREEEYYKSLPIIALTANVSDDSRNLFEEAGMNDFIAKPIEMENLENVLKKWIPVSKQSFINTNEVATESFLPNFKSLNVQKINPRAGLYYTGGNGEMYMEILGDFLKSSTDKADTLNLLLRNEDVGRYTIEIHALKSLSKTIGAAKLSLLCEEQEKKGHRRDLEGIDEGHGEIVVELTEVMSEISKIIDFDRITDKKQPMDKEKICEALTDIFNAMEDFDYNIAEQKMADLSNASFEGVALECFQELKTNFNRVDYEETSKTAIKMMSLLGDE